MDTYTIKLPSVFSTERAQTVLELLSKDYTNSFSSSIKKVVFDFSECSSISPVGLIYIQMWRDSLVEKGKQTFYHKGNKKTDSFLKRMRLLPHTEEFDDADIEKKFFYDIHKCQNIEECSSAHREIVSNVVQREKMGDETYCAVDYMINELWDNAGVHGYECYDSYAYPKPVYICALEENEYYEVCIGDRGQGIYNSLRKNNTSLRGCNRKESVMAAIKNGISGHPHGSPGFGLYSSAEFIRKGGGTLYLWSSNCYLTISSKNDRIYNSSVSSGTLVSFVIKKDAVLPFEAVLGAHTACEYHAKEYTEDVIGGLFDEQ